jgi:hypothetical protein
VNGKRSSSLDAPRCRFAFADGRRCALPAHPQGDGLCYPHAHAPHRRLRPSDLTRELTSPSGAAVSDAKIHRVLAKLPIALADGLVSPSQAGILTRLCNLMLACNRQSRANPFLESIANDWNFIATLLNEDNNENDDEFTPLPANR